MGSCIPFDDEIPFTDRIKTLSNEELMEIWEETQRIERLFSSELHLEISFAMDYEHAIVEELFLRACKNLSPFSSPKKPDRASHPETGVSKIA
ncbi:MAG: hypothetical protein LBN96_03635 [Desulfovibrio sp.]|jgi:hypothetical protein|nr:hypothetical protein [Desulfovibrio sp.]